MFKATKSFLLIIFLLTAFSSAASISGGELLDAIGKSGHKPKSIPDTEEKKSDVPESYGVFYDSGQELLKLPDKPDDKKYISKQWIDNAKEVAIPSQDPTFIFNFEEIPEELGTYKFVVLQIDEDEDSDSQRIDYDIEHLDSSNFYFKFMINGTLKKGIYGILLSPISANTDTALKISLKDGGCDYFVFDKKTGDLSGLTPIAVFYVE